MTIGHVSLRSEVTGLFNKWDLRATPEQEKIWAAWVRQWTLTSRHLQLVASEAVDPIFQARAITVLLAPDPECIPFFWNGNVEYPTWDPNIPLKLLTTSRQVIGFTAELLLTVSNALRAMECTEEVATVLDLYNLCVIPVLTLFREGDPLAQILFNSFRINDYRVYDAQGCTGDTYTISPSGYNPFGLLMEFRAPIVPWKTMADRIMRCMILEELSGRRDPRAPWEWAYKRYVRYLSDRCLEILNTGIQEGKNGNDEDDEDLVVEIIIETDEMALLHSQVQFILSLLESGRVTDLLDVTDANALLQILPEGAKYDETRKKMIRLLARGMINCKKLTEEQFQTFLECLQSYDLAESDRSVAQMLTDIAYEGAVRYGMIRQRGAWEKQATNGFLVRMGKKPE